ncbi:hypothetical protein VTN02DRAFT_4996 [Thermoascus thermophilus]
MDLPPSGYHHRRRSSALTGIAGSSQPRPATAENQEENSRSAAVDGDGPRGEEQKPLIAQERDSSDLSSIAESEEVEMDYIPSDDDLNDDEETGLTARQRSERRRRRRKQRRRLDARIADVKASKKDGRRSADKNVVKRLLVNALLIGLWYLFSLSISIYNKWMFSEDAVVFPFPLFTTSLHMVVQFTLSSLILYFVPSLRPRSPASPFGNPQDVKPVMTKYFYLTRLVPCGTATSLDIGLGNMSLKFISLTFLTMCKSSALAFVLLFAFVFGLEAPSVKLILVIATMTIGVIMMVAGEAAFNAVGFALVISSAFFSGFRWGLTQILLLRHPATSNPFSTLFFLTPVMFLSLIVIALAVEGPVAVAHGFSALAAAHGTALGILLLIFPGVLAFCMISSEFALLKRSSVVTLSICGIFKEVVTISAAGIVFHDKLTPVNVSGLVITIASIASYNYMKITKMRREAQKALMRNQDHGSDDDQQHTSSSSGLGISIGNNDGGHGTVPGHEGRMGDSNSTNGDPDENINIIPTDDLRRGRESFRARASGASSSARMLSAPTASATDNHAQVSPRSKATSPLRLAGPSAAAGARRDRSTSMSSSSSSSSSSSDRRDK